MSLVLLSLAALCQGALSQEPVSSLSRISIPPSQDLEVGQRASLSLKAFQERASLHPRGTQTCSGRVAPGFLPLGQTDRGSNATLLLGFQLFMLTEPTCPHL